MKSKAIWFRLLLLFIAGFVQLGLVLLGLTGGKFNPAIVKARVDNWPDWAQACGFLALLILLPAALDTIARLAASALPRFRYCETDVSRGEARFRFFFLLALVGGATFWIILQPALFPQPSVWWVKPCLLGSALVPVSIAGTEMLRTQKDSL